jgi:hypothetical protein
MVSKFDPGSDQSVRFARCQLTAKLRTDGGKPDFAPPFLLSATDLSGNSAQINYCDPLADLPILDSGKEGELNCGVDGYGPGLLDTSRPPVLTVRQ